MNLSYHSKNKLMQTFAYWQVTKEFADPFYNYLVFGYTPGSCFTSVLANDFASVISRSHPSNTVNAFKALVGWMRDTMPEEAYGSYEKVKAWCGINPEQRRIILEHNGLVFTTKEEVIKILKDEPSTEPHLY
jgi:Txe/YoeB family toxin of Txe-Axe toxin-antitoxin module